MDPELIRLLGDCIATAGRLLELLELGKEDMCACVNGEILQAYIEATDEAASVTRELQNVLMVLQAAQMSGL